jgi:hypothetical protein
MKTTVLCRFRHTVRSRRAVRAGVFLPAALFFLQILPGIPLPAEEIDGAWALEYLLAEEESILDAEIRRLESESGRGVSFDENSRNLALGTLYVFKYIRFDEASKYAFTAADYLENIGRAPADRPFTQVIRGMASSLLAKIKTAFGVGDLKDMERYMRAIPEDYEDWIVRFLRGSTMYKVSQGLPKIFFRKAIEEAYQLGVNDLLYVETEYHRNGVPFYDKKSYDGSKQPVPREIYVQVQDLLNE